MRWAVVGLALLCGPALAEGVYKWTDAQGRPQYGDRPPPAGAVAVRAPTATIPDSGSGERRARQQRLLDAFAQERREQQERETQARHDEEVRVGHCAQARDRLHGLEIAGQVYVVDDQGQRQYLDDGARSRALAKTREEMRRWCP